MIKCPNCGAMNEDGALFCDQCVWDLTGVEPEPGSAAPPKAAAADNLDVALGELSNYDPGIPMAAPVSNANLDAPMAAPASSANLDAPMAGPLSGAGLDAAPPAAPVSAVRPPTATQPPAAPVSAVRPPTATQPPAAPVSAVRPPTATQPSSVIKSPMLSPTPTVARISPLAIAKLVAVRGLRTNLEYPIYDGPNYIGRSGDSPVDIDLTDQEPEEKVWASRQHACVTVEGGNVYVEDLNSANGTWVNKVRLNPGEKRKLRSGDFIQTGTVMFQVKF